MFSSKAILVWLPLLFCCCLLRPVRSSVSVYNWSSSATHRSRLRGIELPTHLSLEAITSSGEPSCDHQLDAAGSSAGSPSKDRHRPLNGAMERGVEDDEGAKDGAAPALRLQLKHRSTRDAAAADRTKKESLEHSTYRDVLRIETLFRRITERKNQNAISRRAAAADRHPVVPEMSQKAAMATPPELAGRLMASVKSGATLNSGEYFIDVFVGTPSRHFSLILDTGSDLNWIQCLPCHDCFEQHGPVYDPVESSSFRNVSCSDPRCGLVLSPGPPQPCRTAAADGGRDQACPYFYWYGDRSNTTGDLALETFTVNLTAPDGSGAEFRRVNDVIFGCGHWNRGMFHGAAGLLGLGRGPLSFSSQLRSLYGHTFSYCLVDRNSDLSVSSKLIFGEDQRLLGDPEMNYTTFVAGKENPIDTFYYVQIESIKVGGEALQIPSATWELAKDGSGGTIIDSGTTLSYFPDPAYRKIREAFVKKVKYPLAVDFTMLNPCYNVSGVSKVELPEFAIKFGDGAVWNFPKENYFIRLDAEEIMCLAILATPQSALSILGNYQQQNFHISYDMKNSRLGFTPRRCAEM
ncbi:aspartyl protease family protein 2-like [Musa acuminata AAA Group]|uniref:aspartyl protease family protein 2-like n=1 Tax=Musa acuminata AAA Group TaxID=214697 RepID=UPI0031DC4C77